MKCKTCGTEHRGIPKHGGYCLDHQEQRSEAAESLAEQHLNEIVRLKQELAAADLNISGAAQTIVTLTKERDEAIDRAAQLEIDNDEMQSYINEIRVALHTEKDELTIEAIRRVVAERDDTRRTIEAQAAELAEYRKLKADIDAGVIVLEMPRDDDKPLDEWEQTHAFRGVLGDWRRKP